MFPNPLEMQANVTRHGRKMVTIVDPHIKRDDAFPVHKEATHKGKSVNMVLVFVFCAFKLTWSSLCTSYDAQDISNVSLLEFAIFLLSL